MDDVPYALHGGDRKRLDARRLGAVLVDSLVLLPLSVTTLFYDLGTTVMAMALSFAYFSVSEVTGGQTVGKAVCKLRTVGLDGEIPSPGAAAKRTLARLLDHSVLGPIVLVLSGRRRQRIGDLWARTVVVDAREVAPFERPFTLGLLGWPAVWIVPALIAFFAFADGRAGGSYRAKADGVCAQAQTVLAQAQSLPQVAAVLAEQERILRRLDPPANWADRHAALIGEVSALSRATQDVVERAVVARDPEATMNRGWMALTADTNASATRITNNGFPACADTGAAPAAA